MAALTALFVVAGSLIGGEQGALTAFLLAAGMNLIAYWTSSSLVLRLYGAQVVGRQEAPDLYRLVDELRQRADLPMPTVAIAPHAQPNAFATGRNPEHAVVCVTEGLLRTLNRRELAGVIAHELAHIKNRDMLVMTFAATVAGAITYLAQFGWLFGSSRDSHGQNNPVAALLLLILGPLAAMLLQMAISRQREFQADAVGAQICGDPLALADALRKLEMAARRIPMEVNPAVAPLAQVNPLAAHGGGLAKWFSTHPPTEERIARLERMALGYRE